VKKHTLFTLLEQKTFKNKKYLFYCEKRRKKNPRMKIKGSQGIVKILMIKSFKDKSTQMLFERKRVLKWKHIEKLAWKALQYLNRAEKLQDLAVFSGLQLEKLKGDRKGQYSIRISKQYRVCFWWKNSSAYEVEITDYH